MEKGVKVICKNIDPLEGNTIAPPLEMDKEYTVLDVYVCKCKCEHIDVGLPADYNYVRCYKCVQELPNQTHLCHPSRFEIVTNPAV